MSELSEEMRAWAHEPDTNHADALLIRGADALDAQAQEIAALRARLAEAGKDAERLDWLCLNKWECIDGEAFAYADNADKLRAWIDKARGGA